MADLTANTVTAPASITLLGDYGLFFGESALALAVDLRFRCRAQKANKFSVNGEELDQRKHPYIRSALLQGWTDMDKPIHFETTDAFPPVWGWDISGRIAACLGAMSMFHNHIILEEVARRAFETENEVTKFASPLHSTASTYGSSIFISSKQSDNMVWKFKRGKKELFLHNRTLPNFHLVLGDTRLPSPTEQIRVKVTRFHERNAFARDIIKDLGQVAVEGDQALRNGDAEALGRIMNENQKLLVTLGVSHKSLDKLITAASRTSFGAKLVGAGGGGCIIALTDEPDKTIEAINKAGGRGTILNQTKEGLRIEDSENDETTE